MSKSNLISYEKLISSKLYSGFEIEANRTFIRKCSDYGYNGKTDGYLILSEFVREKLIMFNLDTLEYEFIDPRFDSKEYFEGAYQQWNLSPSKEYLLLDHTTGLHNIT